MGIIAAARRPGRHWLCWTAIAIIWHGAPARAQSAPRDITQQPLVTGSEVERLPEGVQRPQLRGGWTFDVQGGLDVDFTDNVRLVASNRQSDWLFTPKAIFQAQDVGSRTAISARTEFDYDIYAKNHDLDGFRPKALILGRSDVVEGEFAVEGRLATSLQQISSVDREPATERSIGENQTQVLSMGLRPSWHEQLSSNVQSDVSYDLSGIAFLAPPAGSYNIPISDTLRHVFQARLSNGTAFDRFGWTAGGDFEEYGGSKRGDIEARGDYRWFSGFDLTGHIGHDWFGDVTIPGSPNGPFGLVGFNWNPDSRLHVKAEAGYRYQGFAANANVGYRLTRTINFSLSYVRDIQNSQVALLNGLADLARDPFGNLLLNPSSGLPYVQSGQFDANGIPLPDPNKSPFTYNDASFRRDRGEAGVWGNVGRNSYSFSGAYERRRSTLGDANSWEAYASLSRQLTRHLSVGVNASYERVKGDHDVFSLAQLDSKTTGGGATANYRLGPTVTAKLRYVYLQRTTTRVSYRENVGALTLVKTF